MGQLVTTMPPRPLHAMRRRIAGGGLMLREAAQEIRLHPGRFIATIVAISLGVGLCAAISTFTATSEAGMQFAQVRAAAAADLIVTGGSAEEIAQVDGVAEIADGQGEVRILRSGSYELFAQVYRTPPERLRWATLKEGTWPQTDGEIVLDHDAVSKLYVGVGETITDQGGQELKVVGISSDELTMFGNIGYVPADQGSFSHETLVAVDGDLRAVRDRIAQLDDVEEVQTLDEYRATVNQFNGAEPFKYILYGFGGLSLVVSSIIIGNTLTILVTQRRRQIGLLRAVGASTSQVRGRLIAEALLLGVIGSAVGLAVGVLAAAGLAAATGVLALGLKVSWLDLLLAAALGMAATYLAVMAPSRTATQISPLEALNPVPTAIETKQVGRWRLGLVITCAALAAILLVGSFLVAELALVLAIGSSVCLSVAVLYGAPSYVAALIGIVGKPLAQLGPTTRLAVLNAARNPRRTASTAVALMLAVGLTITLQVALSSIRTTGVETITTRYPIDLIVVPESGESQQLVNQMKAAGGVDDVAVVQMKTTPDERHVFNSNELVTRWGLPERLLAQPGSVVSGNSPELLPAADGSTFEPPVVLDITIGFQTVLAADDVFSRVVGHVQDSVWVKLSPDASFDDLVGILPIAQQGTVVDGAIGEVVTMNQQLSLLTVVFTVLVGVAVLIALVGVANTLGLSVIERQRESALLRALGMQKKDLRIMMLVEALVITGLALLIGVVAGAYFGWLAVTSTVRTMNADGEFLFAIEAHYSIDVALTVGLLLVCALAAALASVGPGAKAARVEPAEALAAQ